MPALKDEGKEAPLFFLIPSLILYFIHSLQTTSLKSGALRHDIHYWLGKDTTQVSSNQSVLLWWLFLCFQIEFARPVNLGWSWYCSHQNCWVGCSSWRTCCTVPWSARPWDREVLVIFQTVHYTTRRWSFLWVQTCRGWRTQDNVVCLQRKTCCSC